MKFATRLLRWYDRSGRHDLPWQHPRSPYRVWVAEIMLQQTQVATVIPYFEPFVTRFPDVGALAAAPLDGVLALWSGLGYYARARNLHAAAGVVSGSMAGAWPQDMQAWQALPGVGRSTAAAILAQAFDQPQAILDGNVRRVLARHAGVEGWPRKPAVAAQLWALAESRLPRARFADYTQAQMDLGAMLCTRRQPQCHVCPVAGDCVAHLDARTAELPTPRPKRARPQRQCQILLVRDARGRWLMQRRPPTGIWGGLWCPPMVPGTDARSRRVECQRLAVLPAGSWRRLAPIEHNFTHFELQLVPVICDAEPDPAQHAVTDAATRWLETAQLLALGLPAPVRRLFTQFPNSQRTESSCPESSTASNSTPKPKASTAHRCRGRSASASSRAFPSRRGAAGSLIKRGS